jgi:rhodanese-related sulfurtransferase
MSDVPARMAEIPPDAELFVVCHAGGRSQRVAQYLARNGYRPVNVSGGMLAWAGAGRPVVTDDGGTGAV